MTFDEMKTRIIQLTQLTENTAAQHNAAVGRLQEAKDLLGFMEAKAVEAIAAVEKAVGADVAVPSAPVASATEAEAAPSATEALTGASDTVASVPATPAQ